LSDECSDVSKCPDPLQLARSLSEARSHDTIAPQRSVALDRELHGCSTTHRSLSEMRDVLAIRAARKDAIHDSVQFHVKRAARPIGEVAIVVRSTMIVSAGRLTRKQLILAIDRLGLTAAPEYS